MVQHVLMSFPKTLISEELKVKSEKSNGLSDDTARNECWATPNQTSCSRFAQAILCPSSHVLLFSCLSKNMFSCLPKTMFFCSRVFQKTMFSCSHVFPKPCSSVLMSFPQKHVLLFSCLSPKKHVLLSNATCVVRFGDRTSYS